MGHTPLNVVQMLWVNLIMDILGAIAIGTEPYENSKVNSSRVSRTDPIILPAMWRQVLVQSAYQLFVMLVLMFFGTLIFFDQSFNLVLSPLRDPVTALATDRLILDTMCFHTFVLMNMFNQINCRVLTDEVNVFKTLLNNFTFWVVFLLEMFI